MREMMIGQARDNFSAIIASLSNGTSSECLIKNRNTPVARIVPVTTPSTQEKRTFGIAKDKPFLTEDAQFDAMDEEIAEEFGV